LATALACSETPWALRPVPPFPSIAARIWTLAAEDDFEIDDLIKVAKEDNTFSAELLRIANSPLFGTGREVATPDEAVHFLGSEHLKMMATLVAVTDMVRSAARIAPLRKIWVHSLVTAIIADEAARIVRLPREHACTAGLLHNVGILGLMAVYTEEYGRMLEILARFKYDHLQTESDLFEIDHCAAGAWLVKEWNLPDDLAGAIATHHEAPVEGEVSLVNLIRVSWRLSDTFGFAPFRTDRLWSWQELMKFLPNANGSWLAGSPTAAMSEISKRVMGVGY
jgi:putative nucleotidyltransferase with HDIG domain